MAWLLMLLVLAAPDLFTAHGGKALVLLFVRADCPIANRYAPEIERLAKLYGPRGVDFRLVYAQRGLAPEAIEQHRRAYGYTIPALADPGGRYAARAGARTTPEAAVFVRGQLVYRGRIDDRYVDFGKARPAPTRRDLEQVLARVAAGQAVALQVTRAIGCAIEGAP